MFPHDNTVRNAMSVAECRRYIDYVSGLADRELVEAVIRGDNPTWVLFDRQAGQFLQDTLDQKRPIDVLIKDLFSRTCLPVVRRESGVTPAKMIPITDKTIAIQKLNEAVKEMARQMIGQGEQIDWVLTIKSTASDKQDVRLNGPIEL